MELSLQRPQDLVLDRKVAVATLGESLLQTSQDYISLPARPGRLYEPSSQQDRQTSHPAPRSSYRPVQLHTWSIWSSEGDIACPPPGDRPLWWAPGTGCICWGRTAQCTGWLSAGLTRSLTLPPCVEDSSSYCPHSRSCLPRPGHSEHRWSSVGGNGGGQPGWFLI